MALASKQQRTLYPLTEASQRIGLDREFLVRCIEARWVNPAVPEQQLLDDEDLARAQLIHELMADMGANAEAIPIILYLLDQLYALRARLEQERAG